MVTGEVPEKQLAYTTWFHKSLPGRRGSNMNRPFRSVPGFLLWLVLFCSLHSLAQQPTNSEAQLPALETEMNAAIQQVEKIVNQTVPAYRRTAGMHVSVFTPGWFHEGANKPDFNTVDVRTTQEQPYDKYEYVSSDLNPGLVFVGRQLEFNANTKYFYKNRSIPKKKLTETEMVEINRLYRIIGKCEHEIARIKNPLKPTAVLDNPQAGEAGGNENTDASATPAKRPRLLNPYTGGALLAVALLILFLSYKLRTR